MARIFISYATPDWAIADEVSSQRETLAYYLAIQKSRTPEARGFASFPTDVLAYAGGRTVDSQLIADYLERVHLGFKPAPDEIAGALTFAQALTEFYPPATRNEIVTLLLSSVEKVASVLLGVCLTRPLFKRTGRTQLWRPSEGRRTVAGGRVVRDSKNPPGQH